MSRLDGIFSCFDGDDPIRTEGGDGNANAMSGDESGGRYRKTDPAVRCHIAHGWCSYNVNETSGHGEQGHHQADHAADPYRERVDGWLEAHGQIAGAECEGSRQDDEAGAREVSRYDDTQNGPRESKDLQSDTGHDVRKSPIEVSDGEASGSYGIGERIPNGQRRCHEDDQHAANRSDPRSRFELGHPGEFMR